MPKITLNAKQRQAVTHAQGPLLIIAGAGTGKTTVITEKINHLLNKKHLSPDQILSLTYTEKAAGEMLERLDEAMPLGYQEPWVSTFHSFCDRILRLEGLSIGLDPDYKILTPPNAWILIKTHLFDFKLKTYRPLGNPTKFITSLMTFFSRAQDEAITPEKLKKSVKKDLLEVANAYQTYTDLKINTSSLDFGDLIIYTIKLFKTRQNLLKKYQQQFNHILIDEFQDTNYAQYQLIKLLAPAKSNPNLTVVCDDDQSIFKFRGTSLANVMNFKNDYPMTKEISLTNNYRSYQPILNAAYQLIQNNNPDRLETKLKINKHLTATRKKSSPPQPQIFTLSSQTEETNWIINKIIELVSKKNYTYKDFAILTRSNSALTPFVLSLKNLNLPYQLVGNRGLFDQPEISNLISLSQVLVDKDNSTALFHLLHNPLFKINPETILNLLSQSRKSHHSLWQELSKSEAKKLQKVSRLVKSLRKSLNRLSPSRLFYSFFQTTGYINQFTKKDSLINQLAIKNINFFLEIIKTFEANANKSNLTLIDFVDHLLLLLESGFNPAQAEIEDIDTISLTTIHSAKGLEFPVVFMPGLIVGRFPSINRRDPIEFPDNLIKEKLPQGNSHLQEERRLFYVGLTRARDRLFLSHAKNYGGLRDRRPSGFLTETGLNFQPIASSSNQLSLLSSAPPPQATHLDASGKIELKSTSYSQIDTFKTCPLKYKYRYQLKVPSQPHHALTFGQSIHDTLRHFHALEIKGQKLSLKNLLNLYQRYFRNTGYESKAHLQQRFLSGQKALRRYFRDYKKVLGAPIYLEKNFRLNIAGLSLVGKIDRIDKVGDSYQIIDYKTGQAQDKKKVDVDEQLSIYALAAKHALGLTPQSLSLYFLETGDKIETTRNKKDLKKTLIRLKATINSMRQSKFPAKPNYPFPCGYCEYNRICPYAAKKS